MLMGVILQQCGDNIFRKVDENTNLMHIKTKQFMIIKKNEYKRYNKMELNQNYNPIQIILLGY